MSLDHIPVGDRLKLMKFVCSFAWTDLVVTVQERDLVARMADRWGFDDEQKGQIAKWLQVPPAAEETDPTDIPAEYRRLFLDAVKAMVLEDGRVVPAEHESLQLFEELLGAS